MNNTKLESGLRCWLVLLLLSVAPASFAQQPARLLVTNAQIITLADGDNEPFTGYVQVDSTGRIAAFGRGAPPAGVSAATVIDAKGQVLMPGFLSGHSHLAASVRRGRLPDQQLDGLIDNPLPFFGAQYYSRGDLYAFALHGSIDYLRNGITTAFDYPIRPRYLDETLYKEMLAAELASGMRLVYGYNVPDLPLDQARAAFVDFKKYADTLAQKNPRLLKLALAKTGHLGRWGNDFFATEVAIAKEFGLDLQLHFLESSEYERQNRADFKMMQDVGALDVGLIYGHFIHHSQEILDKSVAARARMIWNPLSNGRLGSGLADIPKYIKAGMAVGMGLDGQSTADLADPFQNMRMGLYSLRMKYRNAAILLPQDMLRLHTLATARAIGVADQVGSIEVGKYADLLLVDLAHPDTGPTYDVFASLVFACNNSNVETVFVGGEPVVRRGKPLKFDAQAVARDANNRVAAMKRRSEAAASLPSP